MSHRLGTLQPAYSHGLRPHPHMSSLSPPPDPRNTPPQPQGGSDFRGIRSLRPTVCTHPPSMCVSSEAGAQAGCTLLVSWWGRMWAQMHRHTSAQASHPSSLCSRVTLVLRDSSQGLQRLPG